MTNNKNVYIVIGVLAVLGLAAVGVFSQRSKLQNVKGAMITLETPASSAATPIDTESLTPGVASDTSTKTIEIEAGSFYYKPNEIRVKKGEMVKITLKAVDMMHDFNIDELNVHVPVTRAGNTNTATFTAGQTGTFEYYCSVGQHRKNGQVGTLIVE